MKLALVDVQQGGKRNSINDKARQIIRKFVCPMAILEKITQD